MVKVTELVTQTFPCQGIGSHPHLVRGPGKSAGGLTRDQSYVSYGRRSRAGLRALPPPSHSRGRKAPRAGSQAQDSGIFQHLPLGGASGPLWPLSPRRGPRSPGVPWRVLRLVARCAEQDRSPRRAHSAQCAQSRTGGLPRRKEEGLRDPAPRPTRRGKNPRLRDCGAPCRALMRSPQPPALPFLGGREMVVP